MGDLTKNLSRHEFACKCGCGMDAVDFELIQVIQDGCDHFRTTVMINSGNRCLQHNNNINGHPRSYHTKSKAADVFYAHVSPDLVADYFEQRYSDTFGIGRYNSFTHIDVQPNKKRWDLR